MSNLESEHKVDIDGKSIDDDLSTIHKTIYCMRHAQSEYNESVRNPKTYLNPSFWYNWVYIISLSIIFQFKSTITSKYDD